MKFISQAVTFFCVAYGTRSSLKQLRVLTESPPEGGGSVRKKERQEVLQDARDTLMFWSLFGLCQVFSSYLEFLVCWLPGYYYLKSVALLLVTFPKLRFTHAVFENGVVPLLDRCHTEIERRGGLLPLAITTAYELPFLAADLLYPFAHPRAIYATPIPGNVAQPELVQAREQEQEQMTALPPQPPTPPLAVPRLPALRTPGQSLSRAEALRKAVGESARRLSSLAQLPTPRGLAHWEPWGGDSASSSSDDEGHRAFDLMPGFADLDSDPDEPPSPPDVPRTSLPGLRDSYSRRRRPCPSSTGRASPGAENTLPAPNASRSTRVVKSLAALFSLDVHSPPVGSSLRRRSFIPQARPRGGETAEDMYYRHMGTRPRQDRDRDRQSAGATLGRGGQGRSAGSTVLQPIPMPLLPQLATRSPSTGDARGGSGGGGSAGWESADGAEREDKDRGSLCDEGEEQAKALSPMVSMRRGGSKIKRR